MKYLLPRLSYNGLLKNYLVILGFMLLFCACSSTQKATYFNNLPDSAAFNKMPVPAVVIKKNDLLSINVSSPNPDASKLFNLSNSPDVRTTTSSGELMEPMGYLVDLDGNIRFLMLGSIKAEGLTTKELEDEIRSMLVQKNLLLSPEVEVRLLNFKVTVLGEVTKPTVITVPNERITLFEALGLAGDITVFAKKNNVLVIREDSAKQVAKRINLNSTEIFNSPYYYLKSNDIVYVSPNRARIASASRINQLLPSIISGLSLAVIIWNKL